MNKNKFKKKWSVIDLMASARRHVLLNALLVIIFSSIISLFSFCFMPKKYESKAQFVNGISITTLVLNTLTDSFKSDIILDDVIIKLNDENVKNSDGTPITKKQIMGRFELPRSNDSLNVDITLSCNSKYVDKILDVSMSVVINYFKKENPIGFFSFLDISKHASQSKNVTKTLNLSIISIIASFLVFNSISLIIDYRNDYIFEFNDIKAFNTNVFYIETQKKYLKKNPLLQSDDEKCLI